MTRALEESQEEQRSERVALAVTPTEKRALKLVAAVNDASVSDLLRGRTVEDVLEEYGRLTLAIEGTEVA